MTQYCVGLTGGLASGKSVVAAMFAKRGAFVMDADEIGRRLTKGGLLAEIRQKMGEWTTDENGDFNRAEVGRRVFADEKLRRQLESLLHPPIVSEMVRRLRKRKGEGYVIAVVPLLFESGLFLPYCRRVAVVDCAVETQIRRARARDGGDERYIAAVLGAQWTRRQRQRRADDIIANDGDYDSLECEVDKRHRQYQTLSSETPNE